VSGVDPIPDVDDSVIFPDEVGRYIVFLGKEALLARLSNQRRAKSERVVDRFFQLSRDQAYYFTDVYVLAEVLATVRSGASAAQAVGVFEDAKDSEIRIRHGATDWNETRLQQSPKAVLEAAMELIDESEEQDVKFDEAALVLQAMAAENGCVFSFDSDLRTLARSRGVETLPYADGCWL
jgi:predicted nucleic acid-binding protein